MGLRDVRAQSETDMIREEPGNLVGLVKHRQKQPRKLPHDLIHDAHTWGKFQIANSGRADVVRDRIESFSRQEIVHGVERIVKIERRTLAQIMKHDAAGMEWFGLYRL